MTEPLTDTELRILFPSGEQMQCWDSKLVYSYFRLTGDNRLLLGGGTPITTFLKDAYNNPGVIRRVIKDFRSHFPELRDLSFIQFWPGQIDMTRDLLPVIARPPEHPHMRFILGCVGIPWATFCGSFAARNVLGEADEDYKKYFNYFSNQRHFALPSGLGKVIGKPLLFSLTQQLGEVLPGRHAAQPRRDGEGVLIRLWAQNRSDSRNTSRRRLPGSSGDPTSASGNRAPFARTTELRSAISQLAGDIRRLNSPVVAERHLDEQRLVDVLPNSMRYLMIGVDFMSSTTMSASMPGAMLPTLSSMYIACAVPRVAR